MNCQNCGTVLNEGTTVCPVCGAQQAAAQPQYQQAPAQPEQQQYQQPQQQYQQPQQQYQQPQPQYQQPQPQYQQPQPQYQQPQPQNQQSPYGSVEEGVQKTHTLALVALIVGIFVPLVAYICGGIGISRIGKLSKLTTDPQQLEALGKNKTICIVGIVVAAVINIVAAILL